MKVESALTRAADKKLVVVVDGGEEVYALDILPEETSLLVRMEKEKILQNLDLQSVVTNMENAVGLLYVAYNALSGTKLQSKLSGLQKELLDLCKDSIISITEFQTQAASSSRHTII